jgi:glycosyltransferase involved in cell wall biosynthesis
VFKDGEEALFVHPTDVDGLVQAIERIVNGPELVEKLSTGGYEAVKRFSVGRMAETTEQLFLEVLERRSKGQ